MNSPTWTLVSFIVMYGNSMAFATGPVASTAGPTLYPGFIRKEGTGKLHILAGYKTTIASAYLFVNIASLSVCPDSHPYTLDMHRSCCARKERDYGLCNDGMGKALREWDPLECCPFGDYVPCPDPPCKAYLEGTNYLV